MKKVRLSLFIDYCEVFSLLASVCYTSRGTSNCHTVRMANLQTAHCEHRALLCYLCLQQALHIDHMSCFTVAVMVHGAHMYLMQVGNS
jgi:hypothetical protein